SVSFQAPRRRSRTGVLARSVRVGSAVAAVAVVAISGLVALQGSPSEVAGVDVHTARLVMDVHEGQLQQLDGFGETPTRAVPPGVAAAEGATQKNAAPASGAAQRTGSVTGTRRHQGRR